LHCGNQVLDNEVVDIIPFVTICPIPEPHKFFGLSVADLAMTGQLAETAILRSTIDNQQLEVNGRYFAVENQVNLDDLLSSRPGGVVRIKSQGAVGRLDQGKGNLAESMSLMEYMKGYNEDSTGWSRQSQGNDPSSLNKPETATKANIVTNKADMRVDLIARNFAEGFVELFRMMLKLVCQYQNKGAQVRLSGAVGGHGPARVAQPVRCVHQHRSWHGQQGPASLPPDGTLSGARLCRPYRGGEAGERLQPRNRAGKGHGVQERG
jgi:hypothetical protein